MTIFKNLRSSLLVSVAAVAFKNEGGSWKMDGDRLALDANGNPIYVGSDGTERAVEGNTISRLNGEAKSHRERAEAAEARLRDFEGLDAAKARDALEKLSKIDQKALIDAGEVDRVKDEISRQFQAQIAEKDNAIQGLTGKVDKLTLSSAFAQSQFIAERIAVPREMFEATFGQNFKVEDGKIIPYDASGNRVYSKKRMGEIADIDEAFEIMVDGYAHKDTILRAPERGGSGGGSGGGNRPGSRIIRRSEFEAMSPADQAQVAASASKGEVTISD